MLAVIAAAIFVVAWILRLTGAATAAAVAPTSLLLLGLACLVCAWPGWLQAPPFEPRRWAVELPASLERGAAASHSVMLDGIAYGHRLTSSPA